jgi:sarcosine oxidase subunit beta
MARKIIVCRCEDVTLDDIVDAIEHGYRDIEEVKRYTGLGTGPCQGKSCMCRCALLIAHRTGREVRDVPPFTTRPPLAATPLKYFARLGDRDPQEGPR